MDISTDVKVPPQPSSPIVTITKIPPPPASPVVKMVEGVPRDIISIEYEDKKQIPLQVEITREQPVAIRDTIKQDIPPISNPYTLQPQSIGEDISRLSDLVRFEPAFKNDFEAHFMNYSNIDGDALAKISPLHAISVRLDGINLTLTRHNVTKLFMFNKYQRADSVTILWREDKNYTVRRYHTDWLSIFYDEKTDRFVSCKNSQDVKKLVRDVAISLPNNRILYLRNIMPSHLPEFDANWKDKSSVQYAIRYNVTSWEWQ